MYALSLQKFKWAHSFGVTTNLSLFPEKGSGSNINPTPAPHAFSSVQNVVK